jgi:hypothetical protein
MDRTVEKTADSVDDLRSLLNDGSEIVPGQANSISERRVTNKRRKSSHRVVNGRVQRSNMSSDMES